MKFSFANIEGIYQLVQELMLGLNRLSFKDNFNSFEVRDKTIPAGSTATFVNTLKSIPSQYIIVSQEGNSLVAKTKEKRWTTNTLHLKNYGTEDVIISVVFFK